MTELRINHLIDEADELLDNKPHIGSYCLFMNTDDIQDILSKIKAILPEEIKTAEMILKRRDDIYIEAQNRADRIISEAQNTAANILNESELLRVAREKIAKLNEQVKENCEEMKNKAIEEAETVKRNAYQEAAQSKEWAKSYAEKIINDLERNIAQAHDIVKSCQEVLSRQNARQSEVPTQRITNNDRTLTE